MTIDCSGRWFEFRLSGKEFLDYFEKFNNTFKKKDKPWKKISYDIWCDLKKHSPNIPAIINYDNEIRIMYISAGGIYSTDKTNFMNAWYFEANDMSFGNYLYNSFIKEEVENMAIYDAAATITAVNSSADDISTLAAKISDYATSSSSWCADGITADKAVSYGSTTVTTIDSGYRSNGVYVNIDGVYDKVATKADINYIEDKMEQHINKYHKNNEKEERTMKFANFEFGPCNHDNIRMSMYGLAVKNISGSWVSFDPNTMSIMDVDIFNFDGAKFLYKMPVAIKDIKRGDIIIHARRPMFVTSINDCTVAAVDPVDGEMKEIMVTKSPFMFNFVTKVVNLLDFNTMNISPSESAPFGNIWMLMALSDNASMEEILPLMMLSNGNNVNGINPMMFMLMSDKAKDQNWIIPMMLMSNMTTTINNNQ